ncbi:Phage tail repeat like [Thalassovita litoralis]|uniref:Phage tail repeat like n=1 Tax=Thalassovita litoralis TaxID=1010611 RepID=A0A521D0S7_9RHOB|nr:hypothetical protein [Thalassovita litoralis]SMO65272.1 Phage tail repeat like [Thalassovita litoralis]
MLRFEDLRVRDNQELDRDFFNRRYRLIAESLSDLDSQLARVNEATDRLVELGLSRVNEVLGPALATASAAAENGFLVATSATELTLTPGLQTTFEITDTPARALFAPTPYVVVTRAGGAVADWAVMRVAGYARVSGGLAGEVVAVNGAIGAAAHADWVISASAGLATSLIAAAVDVTAALSLAQQAAEDAATAALAAQSILNAGPVSSVNGQTGAVALGVGDIPSLTELLAGKAASTHGHGIAQVSNLQAALDGKAATSHGHAIADIANLQAELNGKAEAAHTHAISAITNLQNALDGKAATSHGHAIGDVTGLQTALDGKAAASHTHAISHVTGLQTALDGKAASSHSHAIAEVTGLQAALDAAGAPEASDAQVQALTDQLLMLTTRRVRSASGLIYPSGATNWTPDWASFINASWALPGNRTLNNPVDVIPGTCRTVLVSGTTSTNRTVSFGSYYRGNLPDEAVDSASYILLSLFAVTPTQIIVSHVREGNLV